MRAGVRCHEAKVKEYTADAVRANALPTQRHRKA